jgi:hypothetical protein
MGELEGLLRMLKNIDDAVKSQVFPEDALIS